MSGRTFYIQKVFAKFCQSETDKVSARWLGFMSFFRSQVSVCALSNFNAFDKFPTSCFLGCEKPAFTILKNKSGDVGPPVGPPVGREV